MVLLIRVYGTRISAIMFEILTCVNFSDESRVPNIGRINEGLNKIKPMLTAKEGSDGKIKPGLSIWPVLTLRPYLIYVSRI